MTDIALKTNANPNIGINNGCPTTQALAPINPPKHSEPASPINMLALLVLNIKNAKIAPENSMHSKLTFDKLLIITPVSPVVYSWLSKIVLIIKKKII